VRCGAKVTALVVEIGTRQLQSIQLPLSFGAVIVFTVSDSVPPKRSEAVFPLPLNEEERQRFKDEEIVLLLSGFNNFGDKIYNYLKLKLSLVQEVVTAVETGGKFDVRDFGEVIAAGLGVPDAAVKMEIEENYRMISFPGSKSSQESGATSLPKLKAAEAPEASAFTSEAPPLPIDFRSGSDLDSFLGKDKI
jgi:hypothetical protein